MDCLLSFDAQCACGAKLDATVEARRVGSIGPTTFVNASAITSYMYYSTTHDESGHKVSTTCKTGSLWVYNVRHQDA